MGRMLFVTGLSGAGKTTLGEMLKLEDAFVHFNVDVWVFGGNPTESSGEVPSPAMFATMDPTVKSAFDDMVENGFKKLASGQEVDFVVWKRFFDLLVPAVRTAKDSAGERDLVVTFSVYQRRVRDYLRQLFGEELMFVVLNPSIDAVARRKVQHLRTTASSRGQTLSQLLKSFYPDSDSPELPEDAIVAILTNQARAGAVGFEPHQPDEPRSIGVGDASSTDVHATVRDFVRSI